ncbi:hypothetical protein BU645_03365 [Staphylococcus chromogenes]|nr:hypothetical protein BU645_03365 [Staphylococcus chromogenes]
MFDLICHNKGPFIQKIVTIMITINTNECKWGQTPVMRGTYHFDKIEKKDNKGCQSCLNMFMS